MPLSDSRSPELVMCSPPEKKTKQKMVHFKFLSSQHFRTLTSSQLREKREKDSGFKNKYYRCVDVKCTMEFFNITFSRIKTE